ncbi:hypothetical protein ACIPPQ_14560 [Sphingopyxis sp. LARHCG72]
MNGASDGWRAGDLAVCIDGIGWWKEGSFESAPGPVLNQVLRVCGVYCVADMPSGMGLGLEFDEFPNEIYEARNFRRIEADHSAADDAEIVALIKGARVGARA